MFVDQGKMWGHIPAAEQDFFLGGSTIAEKYTDGRTTTMKTQKDAIEHRTTDVGNAPNRRSLGGH